MTQIFSLRLRASALDNCLEDEMMAEKRREVGIVKALYRYPVKSMKGEAVAETHVG